MDLQFTPQELAFRDEVRAFLVSIASQVRDAQLKQDEVNRRLAELERRATDPRDLDEAQVTQLLGEETARVLEHARQAAADQMPTIDGLFDVTVHTDSAGPDFLDEETGIHMQAQDFRVSFNEAR